MPVRLNKSDKDFEAQFETLLGMKREVSVDVDNVVREIIDDVRKRGDTALIDLTMKFDRLDLARAGIAVSADEVEAEYIA
jgi:histidinol dehydrogenase